MHTKIAALSSYAGQRSHWAKDAFSRWLLDFLAAIGAVVKPLMDRASAIFAQQPGFLLVGGVLPLEFIFGAMAAFADHERLALFDPGHGNEKNLEIMIDALVIGLVQTANRTTPGLFVQNLCLWGYAEDKEHFIGSKVYPHAKGDQGSTFRVQGYGFLRNLYYNPEIERFANPKWPSFGQVNDKL